MPPASVADALTAVVLHAADAQPFRQCFAQLFSASSPSSLGRRCDETSEHLIQPRCVRSTPAFFSNRAEVTFLKDDDKLASVSPITVNVLRHVPDWWRRHMPKSIC